MKNKRTCPNGHVFYKSSDCLTCPVCEAGKKHESAFFAVLGAPARRALENAGIRTVKQLSAFTAAEILKLHGMGPATLPKLHKALKDAGLNWKDKVK